MSAGLRVGPARPEVKSEWFSSYRIVGKEYRTDGIGEIVLARNNRESASSIHGNSLGEGVVAKAVVGLPGLASDPQFATFPSFTQANEFAQRRENCACAVVIAIALLNWNGYSLYWKLV